MEIPPGENPPMNKDPRGCHRSVILNELTFSRRFPPCVCLSVVKNGSSRNGETVTKPLSKRWPSMYWKSGNIEATKYTRESIAVIGTIAPIFGCNHHVGLNQPTSIQGQKWNSLKRQFEAKRSSRTRRLKRSFDTRTNQPTNLSRKRTKRIITHCVDVVVLQCVYVVQFGLDGWGLL